MFSFHVAFNLLIIYPLCHTAPFSVSAHSKVFRLVEVFYDWKMKCEFFPQGRGQSNDYLQCEPEPFSPYSFQGKIINCLYGPRVLHILCLSLQGSMHALWHVRDEGMGNRNPHQVCQRGFSRFWENVFDWRYLLCREPRPQTG